MESPSHRSGELRNHRGTSLYKGKSDSLIMRWPSLDRQLQSEFSMQRVVNRKGAGPAARQAYPTYHDVGNEAGEASTPNSVNKMISRTSSTASLSLGIAGPLIFPSDNAFSSVVNGSQSTGEDVDSDEAHMEPSCSKSNASRNVAAPTSSNNVSITIEDDSRNKGLPSPPPISLKFVDVKYKVGMEKEQQWVRTLVKKAMAVRMKKKKGKKAVSGEESDKLNVVVSGRKRDVQQEGSEASKKLKKRKRTILKGITGSVEPGEVLALMGPSGSGKTTLLNLLSGRLQITSPAPPPPSATTTTPAAAHPYLLGTITYNGMPYSKALKPRMGFVMQDDVLYPHLTVKETLMYAALLRLPKDLSKAQRMDRAMEVIYELGLERCQNTIIGGPFLRGVSGGERKRVCMGQEILIDPSLLFLDEPTSGLDSSTALRIVHMLRKISQIGRTVVTTIHQPSSRIFHMFDKLILLSEGHLLYFGRASGVMDYFSSIGFSPQIAMNPPDFLLDLASGNVVDMSTPTKLLDQRHTESGTSTNHACGTIASSIANSPTPFPKVVRQYLSRAYKEATLANTNGLFEEEVGVKMFMHPNPPMGNSVHKWNEREWNATWWCQFCVLYVRGFRERRHEYLSWLRILQVLASAVVIGCLWWHSNFQTERQLTDQVGLLFFIATYWGFFPLFTALFTFPLERAILAKERSCDMYRLSAYFMARTLGDIPLDFCLPLLFHIIVYFMAHLRPTASAFFLTFFTILLSTVASQGMGIAIGAILMDLKKATTLASVVLLTFMLSGGYFVQNIPGFISWIRYTSYNYHTFKLLAKIQYHDDQQFDCGSSMGCRRVEDSTIFHNISLDGSAKEVVVLLSMIIGYRLMAYVALRQMRLVV